MTDYQIEEYSRTAHALAQLRQQYEGAKYDCTDPDQMELAKAARNSIRSYRLELERTRKEIKAPALERCQLIDSEATRIKTELVALEEPIAEQIEAEQNRAKREEEARVKAEEERLERIQQAITVMRDEPARCVGSDSITIKAREDWLDEFHEQTDFQEFAEEAEREYKAAAAALSGMLSDALKREEEAAELEALRKEKAEREAREAAEREAREREERERRDAEVERLRQEHEKLEEERREMREREQQREEEARQKDAERQAEILLKEQAAERARVKGYFLVVGEDEAVVVNGLSAALNEVVRLDGRDREKVEFDFHDEDLWSDGPTDYWSWYDQQDITVQRITDWSAFG